MGIFLKIAIPSELTVTFVSSKTEKTKLLLPKSRLEVATIPGCRVTVETLLPETSTSKEIVAVAAFLGLGTYPIFLARDTTFSLRVALSINTSFDTILALYEEI